jgi:hypothetical protein
MWYMAERTSADYYLRHMSSHCISLIIDDLVQIVCSCSAADCAQIVPSSSIPHRRSGRTICGQFSCSRGAQLCMAEDDQPGVSSRFRDLSVRHSRAMYAIPDNAGRTSSAGGPHSSTANIDVLQIVVESSPPSDTTKITLSESSATADAIDVIDEFNHKADSFSSTAAHLLVMVMALDPSQIKHHPPISSILRVLACWQDASDSKDLATKWVKWLAEVSDEARSTIFS